MLQRIQSVFLFLVVVAMLGTFLFPVWQKMSIQEPTEKVLTLTNITLEYQNGVETSQENTIILALIAIIASILALYSIFSYANRLRQVFLNMITIIVIAAYIGFSIYYIFEWTNTFEIQNQGNWRPAFYMPFAAILFILIANRFIRKDHALVQSVDRLR
jgi:hypothetical protein